MQDPDSFKGIIAAELQDREPIARDKVFERLVEYAVTNGLTMDQLKAIDRTSLERLIEGWKNQEEGSH
jgi:hypothetical protein